MNGRLFYWRLGLVHFDRKFQFNVNRSVKRVNILNETCSRRWFHASSSKKTTTIAFEFFAEFLRVFVQVRANLRELMSSYILLSIVRMPVSSKPFEHYSPWTCSHWLIHVHKFQIIQIISINLLKIFHFRCELYDWKNKAIWNCLYEMSKFHNVMSIFISMRWFVH